MSSDPSSSRGGSLAGPGGLVVISGVSGAGKTTVCQRLLEQQPGRYLLSISSTTRPPRASERDGVHYRFISDEAFREDLAKGQFLEHAEVFGQLYGTPRRNLEEARTQGRVLLLDVDVQGGRQLRECGVPALLVWLEAPGPEVAAQRLQGRGSESEEQMSQRLAAAEGEQALAREIYDRFLVNDDLDRVAREIDDLVVQSFWPRDGEGGRG